MKKYLLILFLIVAGCKKAVDKPASISSARADAATTQVTARFINVVTHDEATYRVVIGVHNITGHDVQLIVIEQDGTIVPLSSITSEGRQWYIVAWSDKPDCNIRFQITSDGTPIATYQNVCK